jgi:AraC-like DNA-binding protein
MLRTRLRQAAVQLTVDNAKIVDVAFEAGFGDVSNFNRAFRAEFGASPTAYRQRRRR